MSNYIYYNGELYHFGVKGMKWGHRKAKQEAKTNYKDAIAKRKADIAKVKSDYKEELAKAKKAYQETKNNKKPSTNMSQTTAKECSNSKSARIGKAALSGALGIVGTEIIARALINADGGDLFSGLVIGLPALAIQGGIGIATVSNMISEAMT